MRWPVFILLALLAALQYPLWYGKGSWLRVWDVDRQLAAQRETNQKLEARNAGLEAEVRDLKTGLDAVEERARFELGLTRPGELFVQIPLSSGENRPVADGATAVDARKTTTVARDRKPPASGPVAPRQPGQNASAPVAPLIQPAVRNSPSPSQPQTPRNSPTPH